MTDIKFRGKRIDTGEWVYGDYFKTPLTDENSGATPDKGLFFLSGETRHCIRNENGAVFVIDEKTLGQYTGETDKNGQQIYENDICDGRYGRFTVRFRDGGFWPLCGEINVPNTPEEREVIGNIHDNPTLLEQKESE